MLGVRIVSMVAQKGEESNCTDHCQAERLSKKEKALSIN